MSDTDTDSGADVLFDAAERAGEGLWAGSVVGIVTGFQTRDDSARVTWVGGFELFSDAYVNKPLPSCVVLSCDLCTDSLTLISSFCFLFSGEKSGNEQFVRDIAAWTFQAGKSGFASTAQLTTSETRRSHEKSILSTTISCVFSC